jgi:hypothetical protein
MRQANAPVAFLALLLTAFASLSSRADVVGFTLIDADADQPIAAHAPITDGAEIDLAALPTSNLSIRADVDGSVGSVVFDLSGAQSHQQTENVFPYALFGDSGGDYDAWQPSLGSYALSAQSFSQSNGGGTAGPGLAIAFDVVDSSVAPPPGEDGDGSVSVSGAMMRWHRVTVEQQAVAASETASPNPFLDYRFDVTFTAPDGRVFEVPGYFAGDGAGGAAGTAWQAHLAPDMTGTWQYAISLRSGAGVAVDLSASAGTAVAPFDGATGSFEVVESDKPEPDFRAAGHGLVKHRGGHYLRYASGKRFIKAGPDIPENLLGYEGFDNTPDAGHAFSAHVADWNPGDPDWNAGAGRGLIGAFNYIAERGANSVYFLPMNIGGDGDDTFPTIAPMAKTRYDLSKLAQWEIALTHAQSKGIWLHFVLAETESGNENYHDGGELGPERKLYYRMLLARFGHLNGIQFNIGEENDYGTARREQFAAWIKARDAYDHPVTTHTRSGQYDTFYDPLLGNGDFDITSFQGGTSRAAMFDLITQWRADSAAAGQPWVISFDEPQKIENNLDDGVGYPHGRRDKMWPVFMAGGGGFEWYVQLDGGGHGFDQQIDDFGEMAQALEWSGHVRDFLAMLPLESMVSSRTLADSDAGGNTYALAAPDVAYALYNDRNGGPLSVDLGASSPDTVFEIRWFDPRTGALSGGAVGNVSGGGVVEIGTAPASVDDDWAVLLMADSEAIFADRFEAP